LSVPSVPLALGVQADKTYTFANGMTLAPVLRLAWRHEFEAERPVEAGFLIAPGFDFKTQGAPAPRDSLQVSGALVLNITDTFVIYGDFKGEAAQSGSGLGGSGGFKLRF
jgi:outer membrane autotransporter protein